MRSHVTYITKEEFFPAVYVAYKAAMTELNILGGFRGAGLVLFDLEHVILQLDIKFLIPLPP